MKTVIIFAISFISMCNFSFASLPDLPTGFSSSTVIDDFELLSSNSFYSIEKRNAQGTGEIFYDVYSFEIDDKFDFSLYSAAQIRINKKITDLPIDMYLYDKSNNVVAFSASDYLEFSGLNLGSYFIGITGFANSGSTYNYSADFGIAPVPVPAAALLLGAGLLGIVGVRRRQLF